MTSKSLVAYFSFIVVLAFACASGWIYFSEANANTGDETKNTGMPVQITEVISKPIRIWYKFSARLEPVEYAEVRPQISGTVTHINFFDGVQVRKGDILYVIDPRIYEAAVQQAEADLNVAKSRVDLSQKAVKRAQKLIKSDAISKSVFDERISTLDVDKALVESAKARLDDTKVNLDYAYVKAPISGQISRAEIKIGNVVQAGPSAPILTSIVSNKGVFADFDVTEDTYIRLIAAKNNSAGHHKIPVEMHLNANGKVYTGTVHSFDNQIDPSSGTMRARAMFKNDDGALLPGMFATIKIGTPDKVENVIVNAKAIGTDQDRKFVYVVNDQNQTEYRSIKVGESIGLDRVVLSGLKAGERIVGDGIIRIRPNMPVQDKKNSVAAEQRKPDHETLKP